MADTEEKTTCSKCKGDISEADWTECDRCDVKYCSKSCLNLHWKIHKKSCAKNRNAAPPRPAAASFGGGGKWAPDRPTPRRGLDQPIFGAFTRLGEGTFLLDRPEEDVYRILIDAYRLRMEDMFNIEGVRSPESLYSPGVSDATEGFRGFLTKVKGAPGSLLPPWWNGEKDKECERLGGEGGDVWYSLRGKVSKADALRHYGDDHFPMQLRMLGEAVYGRAPGGGDGTMVRKMLADREAGTDQSRYLSLVDASK